MPQVTRLPIWAIPGVVDLPTEQVDTLQVLSDLLPYVSIPPRDLSHYDSELRDWVLQEDALKRLLDFVDWTALAARQGLLRWPERDALVAAVRSRWRTAPLASA
jgi:hypothetical protein